MKGLPSRGRGRGGTAPSRSLEEFEFGLSVQQLVFLTMYSCVGAERACCKSADVAAYVEKEGAVRLILRRMSETALPWIGEHPLTTATMAEWIWVKV